MDTQALKDQVRLVIAQRDRLQLLLADSTLGPLRLDVNQAIEELDDLLAEFYAAFPDEKPPTASPNL